MHPHSPSHQLGTKHPLHFQGSSHGLLGSWMILEQYGIMVDCGDGAASSAARGLGSIKDIVLTHSHLDHLSGLTAALNLRHRLSPECHTSLHYPTECAHRVQASLSMLGRRTKESVSLHPFTPPPPADLNKLELKTLPKITLSCTQNPQKRSMRILPTRHCAGSVGYILTEERRRLSKEWESKKDQVGAIMASLSQEERISARAQMEEKYEVVLLAHLGDSPKLNDKEIAILSEAPVEHLILEATLLDPNDVEGEENHSTLAESLHAFSRIQPEHLLLNHFSPRYSKREIEQSVLSLVPQNSLSKVNLLVGSDLTLGEDLERAKEKEKGVSKNRGKEPIKSQKLPYPEML